MNFNILDIYKKWVQTGFVGMNSFFLDEFDDNGNLIFCYFQFEITKRVEMLKYNSKMKLSKIQELENEINKTSFEKSNKSKYFNWVYTSYIFHIFFAIIIVFQKNNVFLTLFINYWLVCVYQCV